MSYTDFTGVKLGRLLVGKRYSRLPGTKLNQLLAGTIDSITDRLQLFEGLPGEVIKLDGEGGPVIPVHNGIKLSQLLAGVRNNSKPDGVILSSLLAKPVPRESMNLLGARLTGFVAGTYDRPQLYGVISSGFTPGQAERLIRGRLLGSTILGRRNDGTIPKGVIYARLRVGQKGAVHVDEKPGAIYVFFI